MATITRFRKTQYLPISQAIAWEFFSSPGNLPEITPKALGFRIISDAPGKIYPGLMLRYSVSPLLGIRTLWVTEITHVQAPEYFVDEQRLGPYRLWHHEHHFHPRSEGGVEVEDIIHYSLPLGWLGDFFAGRLVRRQVEAIFRHRAQAMAARFGNA